MAIDQISLSKLSYSDDNVAGCDEYAIRGARGRWHDVSRATADAAQILVEHHGGSVYVAAAIASRLNGNYSVRAYRADPTSKRVGRRVYVLVTEDFCLKIIAQAESYATPDRLTDATEFACALDALRSAPSTIAQALAALKARALDPIDFDFIEANPGRAHEVSEFVAWVESTT